MRLRGLVALAVATLAGCTGAPAPAVPVRIEIGHTRHQAPLTLDQADGDGVAITRLTYYLGGVRLKGRDGRWVAARADGGDLVLVDARVPDSLAFEALQVAPQAYDTLEFRIGVPPLLADGTARGGVLDPARGMFWTWKAGYVFFALEGHSPSSTAKDGRVFWHAGGEPSLLRTIALPLAGFHVTPAARPVIHLGADLDALLAAVDVAQHPEVMEPATSAPVLDAVAGMFRVEHVHLR